MQLSTALLLLTGVTSTHAKVFETIFDALVPTACVGNELLRAGACTLQRGCADRCFERQIHDAKQTPPTPAPVPSTNVTASAFSLDSPGLSNFYIPTEAVECEQFEDPICPATTCCPACKSELNELYRCIILEGDHHYIDPLARFCALDCKGPFGTGSGLAPTFPPTSPPTNAPVAVDLELEDRLDIADTNATDGNETDIYDLLDDEEEELVEIEFIEDGLDF